MRFSVLIACSILWMSLAVAEHSAMAQGVSMTVQPADVVMSIGDISVTKVEYDRRVEMMVSFYKAKHKKATEKSIAKAKARIRSSLYRSLAQRKIIESRISQEKVSECHEVREEIKQRYVKSFSAKRKEGFDALAKQVTEAGYGDIFKNDFEFDVRLNSYFKSRYADKLTASAEEIAKVRRDVEEVNAVAQATNALQLARGKELLVKARAKGADFAALADRYSEDETKDPGGYIGECSASDFTEQPASYWKAILETPEGQITDVLASSTGFEIIRVDKRIYAEEPGPTGEKEIEALELSRIYLRRAYVFPKQNDEDFAADVVKEKREKFYREFLQGLTKGMRIQFPNGRSFLR